MFRKRALIGLVVAAVAVVGIVVAGIAGAAPLSLASAKDGGPSSDSSRFGGRTQTPIKHVVVIFQENVSFDHYFGTYPHATNDGRLPVLGAPGNAGSERAAAGDRGLDSGRASPHERSPQSDGQPERRPAAAARQQPHRLAPATPAAS